MTYDPNQPMRRPRWTKGLFVFEAEWFDTEDGVLVPLGAPYSLGPYDAMASDWQTLELYIGAA